MFKLKQKSKENRADSAFMQSNAGFDHIIKKNFEGDIQFKRVKKEIQLLKDLNQEDFKISLQNSVLGLKIVVLLRGIL